MSDLPYPATQIPKHIYTVHAKLSDIHREFPSSYAWLKPLYPTELGFYNDVGRMAASVAEYRVRSIFQVPDKLHEVLIEMATSVSQRLHAAFHYDPGLNEVLYMAETYLISCALHLGRLLPIGIWDPLVCLQVDADMVHYRGIKHADDYR